MQATPTLARATSAALLACLGAAHAQPQPDALLARTLAATCAGCHGTDGAARGESKVLAGMAAPALLAQMAAFRSGALPATVMHQIAKGYTDAQLQLIAGYFAAQKGTR